MAGNVESTYQRDYIPPSVFWERLRRLEKHVAPPPLPECPPPIQRKCSDFKESEWTGISPMGGLINKCIVPPPPPRRKKKVKIEPDIAQECLAQNPFEFIRVLRTFYPYLYEKLKGLPPDKFYKTKHFYGPYTTYQIDFDHKIELPDEDKDESVEIACQNLRKRVMDIIDKCAPIPKEYCPILRPKPIRNFEYCGGYKYQRVNKVRNEPFRPKYRSEYNTTINKTACLIVENNLNDHSKCVPTCRHILEHHCPHLNA
ncbi:uncharacterized protein LOC119688220 [Teleopsis dalmanni]|uniref:uncharacterized protein LOC119688220 n=1 Tax=Teleopsis dalmanni TaxID=139649 RepID=UPI0018CCD33F|nr:uncharacterized protein LOC119688220 [Teleopsis dalmanni]